MNPALYTVQVRQGTEEVIFFEKATFNMNYLSMCSLLQLCTSANLILFSLLSGSHLSSTAVSWCSVPQWSSTIKLIDVFVLIVEAT